MSLLLAFEAGIPDVTGSGASVLAFTDAGTALLVFEGTGASALAFSDGGTGLEIFEGSGASALTLTDVGVGIVLVDITGTGASELALTDIGSGTVPVEVISEPSWGGGGFSWRDDRTIKDFKKLLRTKQPRRVARRKDAETQQQEIFSYTSESVIDFASAGQGEVGLHGAGASSFRFASSGKGRFEESAADIIRLLLAMDEI